MRDEGESRAPQRNSNNRSSKRILPLMGELTERRWKDWMVTIPENRVKLSENEGLHEAWRMGHSGMVQEKIALQLPSRMIHFLQALPKPSFWMSW